LVEYSTFSVQPSTANLASDARMWQKLVFCLAAVAALPLDSPGQMNVSPVTRSIEVVPAEATGFPDVPPLPKGPASLIGGTVRRMDPIHDRMVVRAFGGRDVTVDFDVRTRVVRGAAPVEMREVRPGTRVYADTILKDGRIFAKTVNIEGRSVLGDARGQVLNYEADRGLLKVRDIVSAQPLNLRVTPQTEVRFGDQPAHASDLVSGTLVQITFQGVSDGPSVAEKIDVLARPGSTFVFTGRIAVIDLRDSHLTLYEQSGENTFEVGLHSLPTSERLSLKQGADVVVHAQFDGKGYEARSIEPASPARP
jgi:hypothetical protein